MAITIYRAGDLYNTPFKPAQEARDGKKAHPAKPARRGIFNVGKSHFYEEIEPRLEKAALGPKAVGYTGRSVERVQTEMIAAAAVERTDKRGTKATAAEAR